MSIYQRINGADWRNIWVVGDLHGCYTNLMNRLDGVGFDPAQDLLVSVGDLIDRGTVLVDYRILRNFVRIYQTRGETA
ncbi:TPA: YlcG family protein [Klebsiella pneumoniae]|nr:YlcG family protein [Klebsiella pneumoniae]